MQNSQTDLDSGVDHSVAAQIATDQFNTEALERALASAVQDYIILWVEGPETYMTTFRGTSRQRLAHMHKGLRIDVEYGQWAVAYRHFDGATPKWRTCGTSAVLIERITTLPQPKHHGR